MADSYNICEQLIHEVIDGEAVVIDLSTGTYYSLDAVGAHIWECITLNADVEQIVGFLSARYEGSHDDIRRVVDDMIQRLEEEALIVPRPPDADTIPSVLPSFDGDGARRSLTAPRLSKFTDMQDLILLDPVHEVEPSVGWPLPAGIPQKGTG